MTDPVALATFEETCCQGIQRDLALVRQWCMTVSLSRKPGKETIVTFTRKGNSQSERPFDFRVS